MVKILKKRYDYGRARIVTSVKEKMVTQMNETRKDKLLNPSLITLAYCFMMARRLHVGKIDLKFVMPRKIFFVKMTSYYENVNSSNILIVVIAFALYFVDLATHYCEP